MLLRSSGFVLFECAQGRLACGRHATGEGSGLWALRETGLDRFRSQGDVFARFQLRIIKGMQIMPGVRNDTQKVDLLKAMEKNMR